MKLVTTTNTLENRFGLKEAIKRINEYGFDGYDFWLNDGGEAFKAISESENYLDFAKEVRAYADKIGIPCLQAHAPFPTFTRTKTRKEDIALQIRAIEFSAILGAEVIVIHPDSFISFQENFDEIYFKLLPVAEKAGIKIATENMFRRKPETREIYPAACGTPEEFASYVDFAGSDFFTACLDIGHTELTNTAGVEAFIKGLGGKRLTAVHVHDNDKIDDKHAFPFLGKIDWDKVCRSLAEIDYQGNFTFEADKTTARFPDALLPEAYNLLLKTGRYLIEKIEEYKKAAV